MLKLDHGKHWVIWLFIAAFAFIVLYTLWPYILGFIVLYAVAQGFSSTHHHSNHNGRCRRRCRRWRRW
jgi:hypothetical protein